LIILSDTTHILELQTTSTASTDYYVSYREFTTTTFDAGVSAGNISSATTTTILSAPASSTRRQIQYIAIRNRSAVSAQIVTLKIDISGTERVITADITLGPGEVLEYSDRTGFTYVNNRHIPLLGTVPDENSNTVILTSYKVGTASEAAGVHYCYAKDPGLPGAWVPGSPGVNGYWTDASNNTNAANPAGATETGAFYLPNAASGKSWWLSDQHTSQNLVQIQTSLIDLLWYNTGLAVTTTTNQAISQPGTSIPARDIYGTTNGEGWLAGIYVTTATTNGSAVTNTTLTYTNSDGTGSRTGTMASFPATAVAGTFVPFFLAAGDRGIRSIQGVTLGTSYGGGAISLVMFRKILQSNHPVAHLGNTINRYASDVGGTRIYNGTSFWQIYIASATTATIPMTNIILSERAVL
jgi:hypothetical protein